MTKKGKYTKGKILEKAKFLFIKNGYKNTCVKQIMNECGLSKGTFYVHFETKADLVVDIMNLIVEEQITSLFTNIDIDNFSFKSIDSLLKKIVQFMNDHRMEMIFMHNDESLTLDDKKLMLKKMSDSIVPQIKTIIEKGIEKDIIIDIDVDLYSRLIYSMSHDILEKAFFFEYPDTVDKTKEALLFMIERILIKGEL